MLMRKAIRDFAYGGYAYTAGEPHAGLAGRIASRLRRPLPTRSATTRIASALAREEDSRTLYVLIGFGGGRHRCIGSAFAYQQIKAIWSVVLRRFELELAQPTYRPNYALRGRPGPTLPGTLPQARSVARGVRPSLSPRAR